MAYTVTEWKPRRGVNLNKFTKSEETAETVILTNTPDSVTEDGTPFSAENMNKIEQGIAAAHEAVAGIQSLDLSGAALTRNVGSAISIPKSLFPSGTVFVIGRTSIYDSNGTEGVYIGDADSANILVQTRTISPAGQDEPTLLGNVATYADLPTHGSIAINMFGRTPHLDDYARVIADENNNGATTEYYVTYLDYSSGDMAWGNPIIINTSDYQAQSTQQDAGKVLVGGAAPGTFGVSKSIDTTPVAGSGNLITSGAVFAAAHEAVAGNMQKYIVNSYGIDWIGADSGIVSSVTTEGPDDNCQVIINFNQNILPSQKIEMFFEGYGGLSGMFHITFEPDELMVPFQYNGFLHRAQRDFVNAEQRIILDDGYGGGFYVSSQPYIAGTIKIWG